MLSTLVECLICYCSLKKQMCMITQHKIRCWREMLCKEILIKTPSDILRLLTEITFDVTWNDFILFILNYFSIFKYCMIINLSTFCMSSITFFLHQQSKYLFTYFRTQCPKCSFYGWSPRAWNYMTKNLWCKLANYFFW